MSRPVEIPEGIDLRPSGKYRVRVRGPFPSRTFSLLEDAIEYRDELIRAKQTGRVATVGEDMQKLRDLATEHMRAQGGDLAANTKATYARLWKAHVLSHHIADMPLRMITPQIVEEFRDDLLAREVGSVSIRQTLGLMQTIMERGVRHGRIPFNPVKAVKKPSGKRKATIRALSPAQIEKVRRQTKNGDSLLISLLAYSGMRPGEARALTWGDVGARTIVVDKATEPDGTIKATKTAHSRSVRLLTPLRDDLKAYRKAAGNPPDDALIFARADGSAWTYDDYRNWTKRVFHGAFEAAGIPRPRGPYDLRHSAASLWLFEGTNAVQVAKWLGHNVAQTFGTYTHVIEDLDPNDKRTAADLIKAARQDTPRTRSGVSRSPSQSKATVKKATA